MIPWEIKALKLEESALKFLDGIIADYGVYIFIGIASLLILLIIWILSGGLRRRLLKGRPIAQVRPVIVIHIPVGQSPSPTESFDPFPPLRDPPDCDHDDH